MLKIIKTRLEGVKGIWPDELPSVLWAYRMTARTPTGETLFRLAYGSEEVAPEEILPVGDNMNNKIILLISSLLLSS